MRSMLAPPDRSSSVESMRAIVLVSVLIAIALGAVVTYLPVVGIIASGLIASILLFSLGKHLAPFFFCCLAIILTGYALFGRAFAYLGVPPLYVGELVLGIGLLTLLVNIRRWKLTGPVSLLLLFMLFGIFSTVPHLSTYGIDALRDASLWGYAIFALAVAWSIQRHHFDALLHWYGKLLPAFLIVAPLILVASRALSSIPDMPGSSVPMITSKPGDVGVHYGGAAALILLGLWSRRSDLRSHFEVLLWPVWFIGFALAGSLNRGGLISAAIAIGAATMLWPSRRFAQPAYIAAMLIALVVLINPTVELGTGRQVSVDQITDNVKSIFVSSGDDHLGSTREWRLQWWEDIIDYTVHGQYFWAGKGFGINLAEADGFSGDAFPLLRSPHNSHMTVLARMGVPGLIVWSVLQLTFALIMLRTIKRSHRRGNSRWAQIITWLFVYWLAMIVNSSFDVYLEGPQGGIWFWTIFGLGLAACRIEKTVSVEAETSSGADAAGPEESPSPDPARAHLH